jgi:hypothetical protein
MERQVTLKTSIYSDNWVWNLHLEIDANAVSNQMVDKWHWHLIIVNCASDRYWLPDLRLVFLAKA